MSFSPAQKAILKEANNAPSGRTYLSDHGYTIQQANGWWRTCDALAKRGFLKRVIGVEAFQIAIERTAAELSTGVIGQSKS